MLGSGVQVALVLTVMVNVILQPTGIVEAVTVKALPLTVKAGCAQLEGETLTDGAGVARTNPDGSTSFTSTSNAAAVPVFVTVTVKLVRLVPARVVTVFCTSSFGSTMVTLEELELAIGAEAPLPEA